MSTILRNAFLSIGGTVVTTKVRSINPTYNREQQDDSAMGHSARTNKPGLKVVALSVEFNWDSDLDALLWGAIESDSPVALIFRPDAGSVGPTNPQYAFSANLESFPPMGQSVGELHTVTVNFTNADPAGLARSTS